MFKQKLQTSWFKDDYILMLAAVLLLILCGSVVFWFSNAKKQGNNVSQSSAPKIIGKAELTIDFGNGEKRIFEGDVIENETLIDVLTQASLAGKFSYKLDNKNNLAAIDNFVKNDKKSFKWYLNGEKVEKPLNEVFLKDNKNILVKYE